MPRTHSTPRSRVAALAAGAAVTAVVTSSALGATEEPTTVPPDRLLAQVEDVTDPLSVRGERYRSTVERLREEERRRRSARLAAQERFPIRGARPDYGEAGARFGNDRGSHAHQGQDVFAPAGTPLVAVAETTVLETGSGDARGNYVALHDARRDRTYVYFHMQRPARVKKGERVLPGERVGSVGCTGRCFGDHLHFEVHRGKRVSGAAVDPLPLLERWQRQGRERRA